jgi:hypothetical protein
MEDTMTITAEPVLKFDERTHTYRIGDRVVPGVTDTIRNAGLIDDYAYSYAAAAERGRTVHVLCELDDKGTLDESTVPMEMQGYLSAWRRFRTEAHVSRIEWRGDNMHSTALHYAGRIDRLVTFRQKQIKHVLDIKTGVPAPWHRIQTAAYTELARVRQPDVSTVRYCVYLRETGKFRLVEHGDYYADLEVFRAALVIHYWKEKT